MLHHLETNTEDFLLARAINHSHNQLLMLGSHSHPPPPQIIHKPDLATTLRLFLVPCRDFII